MRQACDNTRAAAHVGSACLFKKSPQLLLCIASASITGKGAQLAVRPGQVCSVDIYSCTPLASSRLIWKVIFTPSCTAGLHEFPRPGCDSALQRHPLCFWAAAAPPQGCSCEQCRPNPRHPALTFTVSGMQGPCHAMRLSGSLLTFDQTHLPSIAEGQHRCVRHGALQAA